MRHRGAAAVAVGLLLRGAWAGAQTDPHEVARQHFARALTLIEAHDWTPAVAELEAARAGASTLPVLFNLGLAYRAVGRVHEAIAVFEEVLVSGGALLPEERRAEIDRYRAELRAMEAHLALSVTPAGARVRVDQTAVATDVPEIPLDPGDHMVLVEADGYEPATRPVHLALGEHQALSVALVARPRFGHLTVTADPSSAAIVVDGQPWGVGRARLDLAPGTHAVVVEASGYVPYRGQVLLAPEASASVRAVLSRRLLSSPWFWSGVGVGVAALTVGLVVALSGTDDPFRPPLGVVVTR